MRHLVLFSVLLTFGFCVLFADTEFQSVSRDNVLEKEIIQPQISPVYQPPIITNQNQPKEANPSGAPVLPIKPQQTDETSLKEANPTPVQVDYHPVIIDRNEPKEANPVYAPLGHVLQITDRNEPKDAVIGTGSGPTRVDPDVYEPDDTSVTAKYLSVIATLQSQNHTFHSDYDVDWYYFQAIPGRIYTFYSTSSIDNAIRLYQNDGTTQIDWDDDDGAGMNFYLEFAPTVAGTYRLRVTCYYMNSGAYVMYYNTSATPDGYEIDDSVAYAQEIYPTPALQTQNHSIHNATDVDWYKFMAYTGRIYTIYSTGNLDDRIWLYQSDGFTLIDSDDDDGDGTNFYMQFTPTSNAYYFLKVDPYPGHAGIYTFCFSHGADADGYEPDGGGNDRTIFDGYELYQQSQAHTLHTTTDQDWYNCIGIQDVTYHFWSTGNEDTRIYVYHGTTGALLAWDDDSGEGNNFDVSVNALSTIQFDIKVVGYGNAVGAYVFHYRHDISSDTYEYDNTSAHARTITPTLINTIEQHTYDTWLDEDWFRFQGFQGLVYTFYSQVGQYHMFDVDDRIFLYQDDGTTLIDWDDDDGDTYHFFLQFAPPTTGFYRLKTVAFNGGVDHYAFNYYYTVVADAYEPDNTATTYKTLSPTVATQTQEHTLHTNTEQDWYRFQATAGRLYTFSSTGSMDNLVYLYADAGITVIASDDDTGEGNNFSLAWNCLSSGYYKVKVTGYSGALGYYLLSYNYGALPDSYEPDNSSSAYTNLSVTAIQGIQNHTIHNGADEDWFRFQGIPGKRYVFYSTGDTDTQLYLYADDGTTLLTWDDDNGDGTNFNIQWLFSTTNYYKLKIIGYSGVSAGSYDFYYILGAQPDIYEPDDSATNYTTLNVTNVLQTQSHTIDDATDQDWFRFAAVAGRTYTFYSTGNTDLFITLYQDNGNFISSDDDSGDGFNFNLSFIPSSSAFYKLKVNPYSTDAGQYGFSYRWAPLAAPINVTITRSGANVILTWNAVPGATSYKIYASDNPNTAYYLSSVAGTTATIVSPSSKMFFRVTANN